MSHPNRTAWQQDGRVLKKIRKLLLEGRWGINAGKAKTTDIDSPSHSNLEVKKYEIRMFTWSVTPAKHSHRFILTNIVWACPRTCDTGTTIILIYRGGNWVTVRLTPKIFQLPRARAGIWNQALWLQKLCSWIIVLNVSPTFFLSLHCFLLK